MDTKTKKQLVLTALSNVGIEYEEKGTFLLCNYDGHVFVIYDYDKPHKFVRIFRPLVVVPSEQGSGGFPLTISEEQTKELASLEEKNLNHISYTGVRDDIDLTQTTNLTEAIPASLEDLLKKDLQSSLEKSVNTFVDLAQIGTSMFEIISQKIITWLSSGVNATKYEEEEQKDIS